MSGTKEPQLTARNWFGKASAGLILGLGIAIGLSGLTSWALGLEGGSFSLVRQFTMWIISPIWCAILSFCFLFRSGWRAWGVLGTCAALIWLALLAIGTLE